MLATPAFCSPQVFHPPCMPCWETPRSRISPCRRFQRAGREPGFMQWSAPWVHLGRGRAARASDRARFVRSTRQSRTALAAENLFLRHPLARSRARQGKPRPAAMARGAGGRAASPRAAVGALCPESRPGPRGLRLLGCGRHCDGGPGPPAPAPVAKAPCACLLGSLRREGLDFLIPCGEARLRRILPAWRLQSPRGRPPACRGPGRPAPPPGLPAIPIAGHQLPRNMQVVAQPRLGGLHHEYGLEQLVA